MKLVIDNRVGNLNRDFVVSEFNKNKLIDSFNILNGSDHTLLSVEREDRCRLDVGGGPDWFIVSFTTDDDKNLTLLNRSKVGSEETMELCAGGQYADFPMEIVVDKQSAINALISFFEMNEKNLDWDQG